MSIVPTALGHDHDYTRAKTPWRMDVVVRGGDTSPKARRRRLWHFLAHGGLRSFGRTVREDEVASRQVRFIVYSSIFLAVYLSIFFF